MENKKEFWLGMFIVILMVGSGFGVAMYHQGDSSSFKYKDLTFTLTATKGYRTIIDNVPKEFPFLPQEVESIEINDDIKNAVSSTYQIDITSNSEDLLKSQIAVASLFFQEILDGKVYIRTGFVNENPYNKTIITCADATPDVPVIVMEYADNGSITNEGNCIFIRGSSPEEIMSYSTRIIYGIYGII